MRFPRARTLLENTKIEFINFDNVLHAAKKERASKISGYVSIIYPNEVDLLFLRHGEPFNAGRITKTERKMVSIKEVVDRVKNAAVGMVSVHEAPEELVLLIIASISQSPLVGERSIAGMDLNTFMSQLLNDEFSGFMEIKRSPEVFYVLFDQGKAFKGYFANKVGIEITNDQLLKFLQTSQNQETSITLFKDIPEVVEQATPALLALYIKVFNNILSVFASELSTNLVEKVTKTALNNTVKRHEFVKQFEIEGISIKEGEVVVTPEELSKGFAYLIDTLVAGFEVILGKENTDRLILDAIRDYRFALKASGFFEHSKLRRLGV